MSDEQCCKRDHDHDGNCDRHPGGKLEGGKSDEWRGQRASNLKHMEPLLQMRCGHCGCEKAIVFAEGGGGQYARVVIECDDCASQTVLRVPSPQMHARMTDVSPGAFCTGWREGSNYG